MLAEQSSLENVRVAADPASKKKNRDLEAVTVHKSVAGVASTSAAFITIGESNNR